MDTSLTPLRRFLNLLKVDKQDIISIYVYALFTGVITLSLPLGIQAIINLISGGMVSTSWIILIIFVIAGVIITGIMQIMQLTISENLQQKIFTRSAFEFAYRIPRMQTEAVRHYYIPELVNRFFDTLSVQKGLSKILIDLSSASLQVIFGLILLSLYHPFFILFSILLVLIVYLIFRFTAPQGLKTSLMESQKKYEVAHWLEELARTMETFKLAGDSTLPLIKTDGVVEGYLKSRKAHFKTLVRQYINLVGFKAVITTGLLLIGGLLVINQRMNIGQFVAAEIIIILILASVEKLILSMETIYDVLTAIEKIGHVTDIPLERDSGFKNEKDSETGLGVNLNEISYTFTDQNRNILSDINLNIAAGEKLSLSGNNGAGKSLLLQIVGALYDNFSGIISYDDLPHKNWNKESLHSLIGENISKEDIFKGTMEENISLGRPGITLEEVKKASEIVGLSNYVKSLADGYFTELIPEGKILPKSIKLKIALARAIAGSPSLILLDDNFNQLKPPDRDRFLNHILARNWTLIAITNDPLLAKRFDRNVVIDEGIIIADGRIDTMKRKSWYKSIFQ